MAAMFVLITIFNSFLESPLFWGGLFHDIPVVWRNFSRASAGFPDWPLVAANRQCLDNGIIGQGRGKLEEKKKNRAAFTPPDSSVQIKDKSAVL
jgi:hypothetical protein